MFDKIAGIDANIWQKSIRNYSSTLKRFEIKKFMRKDYLHSVRGKFSKTTLKAKKSIDQLQSEIS